jgi:metal-dependent hydrolase (beta-lactamase superfamily II)
MNPLVRTAYQSTMTRAKSAIAQNDLDAAFASLERAHILGQRYLTAHIATHVWMLRVAIRRRNLREIAGQILRLFATFPGYMFGWVPKGNTGGASVSPLRPMPLPEDLRDLLADFNVWRDVAKRVALFGLLAGLAIGTLVWADRQRAAEAAEFDAAWDQRAPQKVAEFGSTRSLEVIPIVNWRAVSGLRSEPGVSYLIRTDTHTILFDLGYNEANESPSPLEHNLAALGIDRDEIDALFISHAHRDHVGGKEWEKSRSLSFGRTQPSLGDRQIFSPVPMNYPGSQVETVPHARALLPAVASTGPIPRRLFLGRIDEQAMIIHLEGRGLVAIVGCGHQTMPRLLEHIRESFSVPLIGLIGDVHYPHPSGRLNIAGVDVQRRLASGDGLWDPISLERIQHEMDELNAQLEFVALGAHDTSDEVLQLFASRFGARFQAAVAGEPIIVYQASLGALPK